MVAALDQGEANVVAAQGMKGSQRMLIGYVGIQIALENAQRTGKVEAVLQQQVTPAVLEQRQRIEIGFRTVAGGFEMMTLGQQLLADLVGKAVPHQRLGHV